MQRALAAVLNFVVWGLGYLYAGDRRVLAGLLLAGYVLIHYYWVVEFGLRPALTDLPTLIVFAGHLLVSAGLAYDVYTT